MRGVRGALPLLLAACQFERPANIDPPPDAAIDAPPPECAASSSSCTSDQFTACDADGHYVRYQVPNGAPDGSPTTLVMDRYPCPLGCAADGLRCADVDASNGLNAALDMTATSPAGLDVVVDDPTGIATLVDQHEAGQSAVTIALANGGMIEVPAMLVAQPGGPDISVLMVRSFSIRAGSTLKVRAVKPIAIVSHFDIYLAGRLDFGGEGNGATPLYPGCDVIDNALVNTAGGGAGGTAAGGASSSGAAGGAARSGESGISPLAGGCIAMLGIGGGGLQLVSRTRVALAATAVVDISGRHGQVVTSGGAFYASGGGAGGNLVVEAPGIGMATGLLIVGRGGSGAAGNGATRMAANGVSGSADPTSATVPGAVCPDCSAIGGAGGTESHPSGGAGSGAGLALAGGGGSVGRAMFRGRTSVVPPPGAAKLIAGAALLPSR